MKPLLCIYISAISLYTLIEVFFKGRDFMVKGFVKVASDENQFSIFIIDFVIFSFRKSIFCSKSILHFYLFLKSIFELKIVENRFC